MSTRLNNPRTASKVVVTRRCHQLDLSGHLIEQGGWEQLCLPAEHEKLGCSTSIGWNDPRTEHGELLWPERFGPKEMETLKCSLGSYAAAGQLQQRPSPAGGGISSGTGLSIFSRGERTSRPWSCPCRTAARCRSLRSRCRTGSMSRSNRGTAHSRTWTPPITSWDKCGPRSARFTCLAIRSGARMDCPATVQAVRELSAKWPGCMAKLIEDKANGSAVIQMLTREISGILPVNPEGGKIARAAAVSPLIEAGNIYLPYPLWAHDDQVDAMTQALLRWNMVAPQQEIIYYSEPYQISSI